MEWVNQWDYSKKNATTYSTYDVVYQELTDTDSSGELEELRERVDKLTQFLSKVVAALPESAQKEIIEANTYRWKLKGE